MLFIRYGVGVLGMVLAVLAVSRPAATCGSACTAAGPQGSALLSSWEVGELLPGLLSLVGISPNDAPQGRPRHQARAGP